MFSGIIETIEPILKTTTDNEILTLQIRRPEGWEIHMGQSIACDGVCLTVTAFDDESFSVELMPETVKRSTYAADTMPASVNLERAMGTSTLFEGHIVQGHVDELSKITNIDEDEQWRTIHISYPAEKANLLVDKGSITVDGISLTVVEVDEHSFSVSLIPHTIEHTTLGKKKPGDSVNLEYDILGKYIAKHLEARTV